MIPTRPASAAASRSAAGPLPPRAQQGLLPPAPTGSGGGDSGGQQTREDRPGQAQKQEQHLGVQASCRAASRAAPRLSPTSAAPEVRASRLCAAR